ncbi:MAG: tRNA (guanosine(37)-N1)-methyltransferase TrmD [Clostridia bacterium]|nr:tRNA (guanosine(37)-N1)-methyltransferase TrmD [Clostridia bacterium]
MRIDILTLFPEMFAPLSASVIGRAVFGGKAEIVITDIRDYTLDKHKKCDDTPFGGGAGMVMTAQPIASAIEAVDPEHKAKRIYLSPKGRVFNQSVVKEYAALDRILLLCGHYEGVDQRVIDLYIDEELSIGDYVLTGGEIPALAVADAVLRYVDGVINSDSLLQESFTGGLLEYPQYTKPREFKGLTVPEVLISGNHEKIDEWRKEQAEKITRKNRPDLLSRESGGADGKGD